MANERKSTSDPPPHDTRIGDLDIRVGAVLGVIGGITAILVAASGATAILTGHLARERDALDPPPSPIAAANEPATPPAPRLQPNPTRDLMEQRAGEDRILRGYEWVDKSAGIGRIPIERALDLVAQRGLPERISADAGTDASAGGGREDAGVSDASEQKDAGERGSRQSPDARRPPSRGGFR